MKLAHDRSIYSDKELRSDFEFHRAEIKGAGTKVSVQSNSKSC